MEDTAKFEEEPQCRSFFKSVRNYFREYCNCTSIHGFRYFGEKRTIFERVWWFLIFSITLASCIFCIREVYQKWLRSPVIVSFATKETPTYSIPFPAVTICPESKSVQSLYSHTAVLRKIIEGENLTDHERNSFDYMGLVCDKNHNIEYSNRYTFTEEIYAHLEKVNIGNDPFQSCEYMGDEIDCAKLFKPIITDEGLCYTFNMLDRSEIFRNDVKHYSNYLKAGKLTYENWTIEKGYSESAGLYTYPRRALLAGVRNSLTVNLKTYKSNIDHICKNSFQGFRVSLHLSSRIPRPSQDYFRVPHNEVVLAAIYPVMITTSNAVKMYNAKRRECYFSSERPLKYFKIYTGNNCRMECLTNFTLYYCGCVDFYMPRNDDTKICGVGNLDCMIVAEEKFELGDLRNKMIKTSHKSFKRRNVTRIHNKPPVCNCMPLCSDLSYNVETSQSNWDWVQIAKAETKNDNTSNGENGMYLSKLILFFKSSQFIASQRHELYGPTDFLANFGGLLGLFTGFSILSLMEAIYFLTVRLCCNSRLYGYWAGPEK